MPKYKLSVDEIVNTMKSIEMETNLSETELYALLSKNSAGRNYKR